MHQVCRNVARMRRTHGKLFDIIPRFYMLPVEWEAFQEHVRRCPGSMWIRKPCASSRGRGVKLIKPSTISPKCKKTIIQQYVHRPLCVNGYKFDLRVYVAVTSFLPLARILPCTSCNFWLCGRHAIAHYIHGSGPWPLKCG